MESTNQSCGFYGWAQLDVSAQDHEYPGIRTPADLYRALMRCWSAETCAPRMRKHWPTEHPSWGQCSITSFLAQDIFGGTVYGVPLPEGGFHCYNVVDGRVFDLTSEQFGDRSLSYENNPVQDRRVHFADENKYMRYGLLKQALLELTTAEQKKGACR